MIGANRMMHSTMKKIHVGSAIGKYCEMLGIGMCAFVSNAKKIKKHTLIRKKWVYLAGKLLTERLWIRFYIE
jgi:hypothetical protein